MLWLQDGSGHWAVSERTIVGSGCVNLSHAFTHTHRRSRLIIIGWPGRRIPARFVACWGGATLAHTPLRYSAIDMSTFEALKLAYLRSTGKDEPGMLALLAFGSVSGSVGATMVYPLNLVRTRLQASGSSGHPERYAGIGDVVIKTYQHDGWRGFYRGLVPTLAKVRIDLS